VSNQRESCRLALLQVHMPSFCRQRLSRMPRSLPSSLESESALFALLRRERRQAAPHKWAARKLRRRLGEESDSCERTGSYRLLFKNDRRFVDSVLLSPEFAIWVRPVSNEV
jgi:hypothetical protein